MYLNRSSLVEDSDLLRSGKIELHEYIEKYLERLEQIEPIIQAFVAQDDLRSRLNQEAVKVKSTYPNPKDRPPLYGIPVGIKDLIHVSGFLTRAGSNLPPQIITGEEASIVSDLRAQGALIAGKTATEEFAYQGVIPTRNPHNINHSPGGSSAGSAASVAAGICPLAIGTQTLRSVIAPASYCGVVGYKPSYARIPITGTIFCSSSKSTEAELLQANITAN
ncbi:amidase family protein [Paenibacillus eucommiae]|uniref:Asp-tRNA(Asn)/Glu-tRNA(Gln) amidotransferase A subunit family amidase n=1 Tax=Paenibacillus eucommiae TaxID=1355755 RepID=A0ABS4JAE5_9BACL|nr:amidase [Paenibacillus eucommiae]MBP1996071.1 Asp-tRNA(Asn)/Glu-tRNA(Gln) amidotransferase A subunit family amidase [Paenibacillus eucommiae]